MKRLVLLGMISGLVLASCSSGTSSLTVPPAAPSSTVPTSFVFTFPASSSSSARRKPQYVTANIKSVTIVLNTVDGGAPPAGLTTSVTTNITPASCPCTVPGPSVPPGSDNFTVTSFDGSTGSGSIVSTASATFSMVAGAANNETITLNGVVKSLSIGALPTGTADSAFGSPQGFTTTAKDADGSTIVGTYDSPVTISDSDGSGATTLATSGSDTPPAGELLSSSDTVTLNYTGLAILPATITASASGATNGTASFAPALAPIAYAGPLVAGLPEIDLYALTGTGSSATFTASEAGWTNAPYNKAITATPAAGCSTIATTSPASGTSFTTTVAAAPSAGTCTLTLSDFTGGSTKAVTLTYTTSGIGVQ